MTGVDFSDQAIELARALAAELELAATFVRADVYELPAVLDGRFDVVYTSPGVLGDCLTWSARRRSWRTSCAVQLMRSGYGRVWVRCLSLS